MNGLQVLIAKGRKNKRRNALAGNYAPVHVSCQKLSGDAGQLLQLISSQSLLDALQLVCSWSVQSN